MRCAPERVHAIVDEELIGQPEHLRETFAIRLDRWWPDLIDGLGAIYSPDEVTALEDRLARLTARAFAERDPELRRLDAERTVNPDWFQSPEMLGYAAYADRFGGTLKGVQEKIPYLEELGVTYLHLMPLLRPRPGDSDGGYAVADYRTVRDDLGTVADLTELATALRHQGISLVLDLVLNHVAREHAWAQKARAGDRKYQEYFYAFGDREMPDAYERTLPEVFPAFAPGNFTYDDELRAWVWTTFNSWQWDVRWTNPDVFHEYADIVLFLANTGVQVLRLDAIAFMFKRLGTNSQNQPEVHSITQALRAVARIACPAVSFKAEAIVGPNDLVHYLGQGAHYGKVSDIAYHNTLMVQIWSMLAARDVRLAAHALRALPPAPASTAWVTYLRCHDDIGWAIDDADAAAVGVSGPGHRSFLSDYYSGAFPGSPARGLVFQYNPETGDRRISGMAASLAGLESALESGDASAVDPVIGRLFVAYAMVLGWGGIPVVWMGDELALTNDPQWALEPGHEPDNRWAHRPRMPWDIASLRGEDETVTGRMFGVLTNLIGRRAHLPHLHASVAAEIPALADPGILPVLRRHPLGPLLELFNVTDGWRPWPGSRLDELGLRGGTDRISGQHVYPGEDGNLWLAPYSALWIVAD
ncbi:amylosucrase [Nakamurella sp. UYEF19]|uniref:alpha-amylase family protein n=1 Tax=Nakamurella sp. UYEF19 TaxID=1756392 RepID=UPI003397E88F